MEKISWEHLFILPSNLIEYLNLVKHTIKHIWLKIWIFGWSYHQTKSGTLSQRNSRKRAHWCICHINEEVKSDLSINHFKLDFKFKLSPFHWLTVTLREGIKPPEMDWDVLLTTKTKTKTKTKSTSSIGSWDCTNIAATSLDVNLQVRRIIVILLIFECHIQ